jgi:hypothetical protein
MTRLIKAYNERDLTIVEVSVPAMSERGAKYRGLAWVLTGRQYQPREYQDVEVIDGEGVDGYRVVVKLRTQDGLRDDIASMLENRI